MTAPAYSALESFLDETWRTASELADLAGCPRRGAGQRCQALVRAGLAEEQRGLAPTPHSDEPPRRYRRRADWRAP